MKPRRRDGMAQQCPSFNLDGHCILLVGGRKQHVCHFRRVVENCNGCFASHDGGVEENMGRLRKLFQRADVVLFPVDNISHAAQSTVKEMCRRCEKPFLPLRSSGLGSFLQALSTVAGRTTERPAT